MEIGSKIRALRTERGITQEALAQALNLSAQAVSKWETGQSTPDIELLPRISVFFGVTIDELFAMTDDMRLERIRTMLSSEVDVPEGELERAERFLKERLSAGGERAECLELLCALDNMRADMSSRRAAEYARQGLALDPERKGLHSGLVEAMRGARRDWYLDSHAQLIEFYEQLCADHPDCGAGWQWLADNLIADGRAREAAAAVDNMQRLMPGGLAQAYRGWVALAMGEREEALAILEDVERAHAGDWRIQLHLGDMKARMCMYEEAVAHYERALEMQPPPRYTDALHSIARIRAIQRRWAEAASALDGVLKLLGSEWGMACGTACDRIASQRDEYLKRAGDMAQ